MKVVKYSIAGLSLLLILVLLPGIVKPGLNWEQNLQIRRPVKSVYFAMINPMKMGEWIDGFEKIEALGSFSSGAGSKYLLTLRVDDKIIKIGEEVTSFKWKEELGLLFHFPQMEVDVLVKFSYNNGKTYLDIHTNIRGSNPFQRTGLVLFQKRIQQKLDQNFLNLKVLLENKYHHSMPH